VQESPSGCHRQGRLGRVCPVRPPGRAVVARGGFDFKLPTSNVLYSSVPQFPDSYYRIWGQTPNAVIVYVLPDYAPCVSHILLNGYVCKSRVEDTARDAGSTKPVCNDRSMLFPHRNNRPGNTSTGLRTEKSYKFSDLVASCIFPLSPCRRISMCLSHGLIKGHVSNNSGSMQFTATPFASSRKSL